MHDSGTTCEAAPALAPSPLAAAVAAVAQPGNRNPRLPVCAPDPAHGWIPAGEIVPGGHTERWVEDTRLRSPSGHRPAAAVEVAGALAQALLGFAAQSIFLAGIAPDLSPANVSLRWRGGRLDRAGLAGPAATVLAGHPASSHPQASPVPGERALDRRFAGQAAATLGPLLAAIRAHAGTGLVTLWGRAADVVHLQMLCAARDLGYDTHAAWARASQLTDALGQAVPKLHLRPRPFPVRGVDQAGQDWRGTWLVRGACCFRYKAEPGTAHCNTCPLLPDTGRSFDWPREYPPAALRGAPCPQPA